VILIVHLWLKTPDVAAFEAFERKAAAVMARHGGRIERVLRTGKENDDSDPPFEVHIVRFPDEKAFRTYRDDPQTLRLAPLRNEIIARTLIWKGSDVEPY
jgi:uncharacterized protein (DUF1330 family)